MNDVDSKIPEKFLQPYDPNTCEASLYEKWEDSGYFNPDICIEKGITAEDAETFSIVLPPPNVTGVLHMGHAAMLAIEDILVRYNRMCGKRTLWIPGTDHASIATQSKVEKEIYKSEKKSRHDLGRDELLRRIEDFAKDSHDTIVSQVRRMGASLDWSREAFTLDEQRSKAVFTAFKNMYDAGLLYRKNRIVNWDPKGQTTVSDDEVDHEDITGTLYTFKYSKDFPISIATTRPETKVGDTAVAVHPDDQRYKKYIGSTHTVEFAGTTLSIKVVADEHIDPEFGTGAVGVTPAHSQTDWEIGERHDLASIQVINEYAKMTSEAGELVTGLKTKEAREVIIDWIKENNLLEKEEEIEVSISKAERTGGVIEPLPKLQWWVDTEKEFEIPTSHIHGIPDGTKVTLKKLMQDVVHNDQIEILPERFKQDYFRWIDNLRPWCISRQIWYGHRIPVWYKDDEIFVGVDAPENSGWEQDPDTLDTWFSSGLWTFSTLGWPECTEDLATYHPTTVLETGYDILFFWVTRMVLMSAFHLGDIPFKYVYLHGLVRDEKGQKMSKSLGNIIDPVSMIDKYGADATRLSLIIGAAVGNDIKLKEQRIKGYKHFSNKLWNVSRFILENTVNSALQTPPAITPEDQKHLDHLAEIIHTTTEHIEKFRLDIAADTLYHYLWHEVADNILEDSKGIFQSEDQIAISSRRYTLTTILHTSLKLLHPFMPFITEEIWQSLPQKETAMLMVTPWPNK